MEKSPSNTYLELNHNKESLVFNHKKESIVRVAYYFVQCFDIQAEPHEPPKNFHLKFLKK